MNCDTLVFCNSRRKRPWYYGFIILSSEYSEIRLVEFGTKNRCHLVFDPGQKGIISIGESVLHNLITINTLNGYTSVHIDTLSNRKKKKLYSFRILGLLAA